MKRLYILAVASLALAGCAGMSPDPQAPKVKITPLGSHAGESNEAHRDGDGQIEAHPPHQPQAADEREGQREHDDECLRHAAEVEIEQQHDDHQRQRYDDRETLLGALVVLVLPAPDGVVARWKLD